MLTLRGCSAVCEVIADRWVQPHLAVRSWFDVNQWSGSIAQRAQVTPL